MFDLSVPWWEFVVRASAVYLVLLTMVRLTGKRTVGQFTPFDLVVVLLLSEAVSGAINAQDESLGGGLIAAATLVVLDSVIAIVTARSKKADALLEGSPVLIGRDGVIYKDVLKRERVPVADVVLQGNPVLIGRDGVIYDEVLKHQRVPRSDVEKALRGADCQIEDMRMAILEADGNINIMKKP